MGIALTEKAAQHVQEHLAQRTAGVGIRLGVKTTGCSGLAYVLEFVDQVDSSDKEFSSHGINVFIDPKSLEFLDGTIMDYVKNGLNEGFEFTNPNTKGECGCGESFTV